MNPELPKGKVHWRVKERAQLPKFVGQEVIKTVLKGQLTSQTRFRASELVPPAFVPNPTQVIRYENTDLGGVRSRIRQLKADIVSARKQRREALKALREDLKKEFTGTRVRQRIVRWEEQQYFVTRRVLSSINVPLDIEAYGRDLLEANLHKGFRTPVKEMARRIARQSFREHLPTPPMYATGIAGIAYTRVAHWDKKRMKLPFDFRMQLLDKRDRYYDISYVSVMVVGFWYEVQYPRVRRIPIREAEHTVTFLRKAEYKARYAELAPELFDRYESTIKSYLSQIEELKKQFRKNSERRFHCAESGTEAAFMPHYRPFRALPTRDSLLPVWQEHLGELLWATLPQMLRTYPTGDWSDPYHEYESWADLVEVLRAGGNLQTWVSTQAVKVSAMALKDRDGSGYGLIVVPTIQSVHTDLDYSSQFEECPRFTGGAPKPGSVSWLRSPEERLFSDEAVENIINAEQLLAARRLGDLQTASDTSFSIVRSTAELKDLPETASQVVDFFRWAQSSGFQPRDPMKKIAGAYLAYKFAVAPTADDVHLLLEASHRFIFDIYRSRERIIRQLEGYHNDPVLRRAWSYPYNVDKRKSRMWKVLAPEDYSELEQELPFRGRPVFVAAGRFSFVLDSRVGADPFAGALRQPDLELDLVPGESLEDFRDRALARLADEGISPLTVKDIPYPLSARSLRGLEDLDAIRHLLNPDVPTPGDVNTNLFCVTRGVVFSRINAQDVYRALAITGRKAPFSYALLLSKPAWLAWELWPMSFVLDWFTTSHSICDLLQSELNKLVTGVQIQKPWSTERSEVYAEGGSVVSLVRSVSYSPSTEYDSNIGRAGSLETPWAIFPTGSWPYRCDEASVRAAERRINQGINASDGRISRIVRNYVVNSSRGQQTLFAKEGVLRVQRYLRQFSSDPQRTGLYRFCRYPLADPSWVDKAVAFGIRPRFAKLTGDIGRLTTLLAMLQGK